MYCIYSISIQILAEYEPKSKLYTHSFGPCNPTRMEYFICMLFIVMHAFISDLHSLGKVHPECFSVFYQPSLTLAIVHALPEPIPICCTFYLRRVELSGTHYAHS